MSGHTNCWKSEYDWVVSLHSDSGLRETVLSVLFDYGTQRRFSRVRITLLCNKNHRKGWKLTALPSSLSVVNHVPPESLDRPIDQNDSSLPVCNIVFLVGRHTTRSKVISAVAELVLVETGSPTSSNNTIFEFDQPLTEITQSVSVSFTSLYRLWTPMTHGDFSGPSFDHFAKVGRVVRVLPVVPVSERRTIPLPIDVLLFIFEYLHSPRHRGWRKDVLSCALVCRGWTCALNVLSIDFHSEDGQQGYPPEITGFANALVARPSLGLGIKFLSAGYLDRHPAWDPYLVLPSDPASPSFLANFQFLHNNLRRSQFSEAFLSILRVAQNVQTLRLDPRKDLVISPDDFADALRGLSKVQAFKGRCPLSMSQFISCIVAWPSLKRLCIFSVLPPSNHTLPLTPLSCCLTEIEFMDVPIKDEELACLVGASGATLERLKLNRISRLTNAGLAAALNAVCGSLTCLYILSPALARAQGEAHALDTTITRMVRLVTLDIVPEVASERMLERRTEAYERHTTPALTEVHLHLMVGRGSQAHGLVEAVGHSHPGWKIRM